VFQRHTPDLTAVVHIPNSAYESYYRTNARIILAKRFYFSREIEVRFLNADEIILHLSRQ
jgi:hypothetical protein